MPVTKEINWRNKLSARCTEKYGVVKKAKKPWYTKPVCTSAPISVPSETGCGAICRYHTCACFEARRARMSPSLPLNICRAYWVGRSIWVKPMVLTVRSIGVSGGNKLGVRKFVSNW
jgi:hypothetical protein